MPSQTWPEEEFSSRLDHDYDFFLSTFIPGSSAAMANKFHPGAKIWARGGSSSSCLPPSLMEYGLH